MMPFSRIAMVLIVSAMATPVIFASSARVESMGKSSTFFMDDNSIFENPANINVYPNFLVGELGVYTQGKEDKIALAGSGNTGVGSDVRYNRDPVSPWFGGIFTYSFGNKETGNLYPQVSLGGTFNHVDPLLSSVIPDSIRITNPNISLAPGVNPANYEVPNPVTNFDGFLGFTLANGGMLGSHIYVGVQEGASIDNNGNISALTHNTSIYMFRGDLGLNWPLARNIDGELSFGLASIKFGPSDVDAGLSMIINARAFSTVEIINGELVPTFKLVTLEAPGTSKTIINAGLGVNASLDRGFFWLGLEGVYESAEYKGYGQYTSTLPISAQILDYSSGTITNETVSGIRISFGIERNIWWDWFVMRVGGNKLIAAIEETGAGGAVGDRYYWYSNPESNGTNDDQIGFGIGVNIEERLKVDATIAEDFVYTFGNLISGSQHHVISRISATYSF